MIIIGLTGGIGMGKTTVTAQLAALGAKTHNSDIAVHALLGLHGDAVKPVGKIFPGALKGDHINRKTLSKIVFNRPDELKKLESILHPLVVESERRFVARCARLGVELVVLDIPLLFETNAEERCDITLCVTAPVFIQRQRVMAREGMTEEKFRSILRLQMPDSEKRRRADVVIYTGLGRAYSFRQLKQFIMELGESECCVK